LEISAGLKKFLPIYENSLLYKILEEPTYQRLKSREPWEKTFENVRNFSLTDEWKIAWENGQVVNSNLISDPTIKVPGFSLERKAWTESEQTVVDAIIV